MRRDKEMKSGNSSSFLSQSFKKIKNKYILVLIAVGVAQTNKYFDLDLFITQNFRTFTTTSWGVSTEHRMEKRQREICNEKCHLFCAVRMYWDIP